MTDELTPDQEAAVRRLLAEARHDEPVPADVAARLDGVLDDLVAGGVASDTGSVIQLAGVRRRRRNAGRLLLAAAAVVVGGVAVGQTLDGAGLGSGGDSASSADDAGGQAAAPRDSLDGGAEADRDAAGGDTGGSEDEPDVTAPESAPDLLETVKAPLRLTSENFATDVQRELRRTAAVRRDAALADFDGVQAYAFTDTTFACPAGAYGEGAKLPAYYDAEEAVLVLRRPRAGIQRVDLLTCGTAVPLNSVNLPAP